MTFAADSFREALIVLGRLARELHKTSAAFDLMAARIGGNGS